MNKQLIYRQPILLTEREPLLRFVIVDLQRRVGARAAEPDHVILAVVHLGRDVPHRDVLRSQVVVDVDLSGALKNVIRFLCLLMLWTLEYTEDKSNLSILGIYFKRMRTISS